MLDALATNCAYEKHFAEVDAFLLSACALLELESRNNSPWRLCTLLLFAG